LVVCRLIAADDVVPSSSRRRQQDRGPEELPWFLGSSALGAALAVANLDDFRIEPGYGGPATVAEQICAAAVS
jgi:hypothetical protein